MTASLTSPEWIGYQEWIKPNMRARYGNASRNGYLGGFRDGVVYAGPSWVTITPAQQLEHVESCRDMCVFCEPHRAIGSCSSCGDTKEALPPEGLSRCCGSLVVFAGEMG